MKLVHLIQSLLFGVVVFGRAIEEQIADTSVVTGDAEQLPYRFRYNVANPVSGDYKSQTETRNGDGVVTGMYKVLQPDGCVRVVHYTADAMGFHPTVTYEGDCKRRGSISAASQVQSLDSAIPSTKEISTPINPSTAGLSRPVIGAVPGLINPLLTAVRYPAGEISAAEPSQPLVSSVEATPSEKFIIVPAATMLSPEIFSEIDNLGEQPIRPETLAPGSVSTAITNENAVKTAVESEEISVGDLPEALTTMKLPVIDNNTPSGKVQSPKQQLAKPVAVPSVLTGDVESSVAVPDSILSLWKSFDPIKTVVQNGEVDRLLAQSSQFSERTLKTEPDSAFVSPAVKDSAIRDVIEENIQSNTSDPEVVVTSDEVEVELRQSTPEVSVQSGAEETVLSKSTETVELRSIPQPEEVKADIDDSAVNDEFSLPAKSEETVESKTLEDVDSEVIGQSDEKETEKERFLGSLAQSALANVQNLTAPLTQLISSSVQNLSNPLTTLLHTFNKNKFTSTVAPPTISPAIEVTTTIAPAGKILTDGETEDIPAERTIVSDHHNQVAFTGTDGVSDLPAISEDSQQTILISEGTSADAEQVVPKEETVELKQSVDQHLESVSIEVNDPAVVIESGPSTEIIEDSAEPAVESISVDPVVSRTIVSDCGGIPAVAEGPLFESLKLVDLERQPTEQIQADVRDISSLVVPIQTERVTAKPDRAKENAESYLLEPETPVHNFYPESYATISDPVPVIYSQLQTAPFFVHQPAADYSSQYAYPAPVRQSTARSVDSVASLPYGFRVHAFVPNYGTVGNAPPSYVYNQHRRQGQFYRQQHYMPYRRFAPVAPIRRNKKGEAYGMRYAAVQTSPMKSRYAVRLPAVQQPTPLYSTYVY